MEDIFSLSLPYAVPDLKRMLRPVSPELDVPHDIRTESGAYAEAQRLLEFLRPFRELDVSVVPDNSLLREFVGYKGLGKSFLNH